MRPRARKGWRFPWAKDGLKPRNSWGTQDQFLGSGPNSWVPRNSWVVKDVKDAQHQKHSLNILISEIPNEFEVGLVRK